MTNYVDDGTASVTHGDTTITFTGVSLNRIRAGDMFIQGAGAPGIIGSIDIDAGTAELAQAWPGDTSSAEAYAVLVIPQASELANNTRTVMAAMTGAVLGSFIALTPATAGQTIAWNADNTGWDLVSGSDLIGPIDASDNPISNITTSMFAPNVVDTDSSFAANSDTRLATQAATKAYVTNAVAVAITGLTWKAAVQLRTTGNVTLSGEQTIDGVLTSGSRVLVMAQTTASQNGVYVTGSGSWTRSTDADTGAEIVAATVKVTSGSLYADTAWYCTNDAITLGSTSIVFQQVPMAVYTAGTGLTLTGTQFSIANGAITSALLASSLSLTTPALGVATATSLAIGGATPGSNALAVTGAAAISGVLTAGNRIIINAGATTDAFYVNSTGSGGAYAQWQNNGTSFCYVGGAFNTLSSSLSASDFAISSQNGVYFQGTTVKTWINGAYAGGFASDASFIVGTSTSGGWGGNSKFAAQSALTNGIAVSGYSSASGGGAFQARIDNTNGYLIYFNYTTTHVGDITTNGSVIALNGTSDARYKLVDGDQSDLSEMIRSMFIGDFNWKDGEGFFGFGPLAQDMYALAPNDHIRNLLVTKPSDEAKGKWSVNMSVMPYVALWGVKNLYAVTDELLDRAATNDGLIAALTKRAEDAEARLAVLEGKAA